MHIAPHTIEVAAMWAVLTRLAEPKKAGITKLQKLKLYNGKSIPGFTEDSIKELKEEAPREGMQGISPALHPGQDQQRAGQPPGAAREGDQPVHGDERAGRRPDATTR